MSQASWPQATTALDDIGAQLGVSATAWPASELPDSFNFTNQTIQRSVIENLDLKRIQEAIGVYQSAMTLIVRLAKVDVLSLTAYTTQDQVNDFLSATRGSPTVLLDLQIDKGKLIAEWFSAKPQCRAYLFLFEDSLVRYLTNDISRVEELFFLDGQQRKTVFILPDQDAFLDGPHLAIIGGNRLSSWDLIVPTTEDDLERARTAYASCRKQSNWQQVWVQRITPFHLALEYPEAAGQSQPTPDPALRAVEIMYNHFANLSLLFTAQRSESRNLAQTVTFPSASRIVDFPLRPPTISLLDVERPGISELLKVVTWTYDEHQTSSRFALVQDTIVRELLAVKDDQRYSAFLQRAPTVMTQLNWRWQAFIGEKVDTYLSQVREFENDVDKTVQAFADQLASLTKSLTDTMLGAVAAVVGVLVASVIKEKFNPWLFILGIAAYALYVGIFHLRYGLSYQQERFGALRSDFTARKQRFSERVPAEQVENIVGSRISDSETRWNDWYERTKGAYRYLLIVLGLLVVIALIIGLVGLAGGSGVATSTPIPLTPTP